MDAGVAIVAIPEQNDRTWLVSSEEIPHMTLLFLGRVPTADVPEIARFVNHVAENTLSRFWTIVSKRGVLGDQKADVLFFEKNWALKPVYEARAMLLQFEPIRRAYDNVEQYPQWTPHLTLGYPKTPANNSAYNDQPISSVYFDRLALWIGDFDGPEFDLKEAESEVAMSDELAHYGVKGMKWGVRKSRKGLPPSDDKVMADSYAARVSRRGDTSNLSNKELQALVQRMNLEQQYSRLAQQPGKISRGKSFVKATIDSINTGKQVWNLAPTPEKKMVETYISETIKPFAKRKVKQAVVSTAWNLGKMVAKAQR